MAANVLPGPRIRSRLLREALLYLAPGVGIEYGGQHGLQGDAFAGGFVAEPLAGFAGHRSA